MIEFDYVREVGQNLRIHGNGFIQIDMPDGKSRVHIFGHPDVPRQKVPTPIHDHRWGFLSTVMAGCLINLDWKLIGDERDEHTHYVCGYEPSGKGAEDTALIPTGDTGYLKLVKSSVMPVGYGYSVQQGELHETFANEPTITVMSKKPIKPEIAAPPRVLCRIGLEPDNHFTRYDYSEDDIWRLVKDAFRWVR